MSCMFLFLESQWLEVEWRFVERQFRLMSTVQEIEAAIEKLPRRELWELKELLDRRCEADWDQQIEQDAESGKLDFLSEEAEVARREGALRGWPGAPQ